MASRTAYWASLRIWLAAPQAIATLTFLVSAFLIGSISPDASAVPREDRSLGSRVNPAGENTFRITGGRSRRDNLFHSFETFDIAPNERVFFEGGDFENIFSRVTGGDGSDIFGTLGVNGDANLFLMDPRGIVFGPNARLDLRGSFVATTADEIEFGRRGSFQANLDPDVPDAPLRVSPSAFVFNQVRGLPDIGDRRIVNEAVTDLDSPDLSGGLNVDPGRSLVLLGGEVEFNGGYARATGGRIQIGGLSAPGTVDLDVERSGREFRLTYPTETSFADIRFAGGSVVDVMGSGGGDIAINGQNVEIIESSQICGGLGAPLACARFDVGDLDFEEPAAGRSRAQAGNITIGASGLVTVRDGAQILNNVRENAIGNNRQDIQDAVAEFSAASSANQDINGILFGSILIAANGIQILNDGTELTQVSTDSFGQGNAGLVFMSAGTINLQGQIPDPPTGLLTPIISSSVQPSDRSDPINAGGIYLVADVLTMTDFAAISSSTFDAGNPGIVQIQASQVLLSNDSIIFTTIEPGGVADDVERDIQVDLEAQGRVARKGEVFITADRLLVLDGSQIQTLVRGNSGGGQPGRGDAGNIVILAGEMVVDGSSSITGRPSLVASLVDQGAIGDGGFIFLIVGSDLVISNSGLVSVDTAGRGEGGDILIFTGGNVFLEQGGVISSLSGETATGDGGQILAFVGGSFWARNESGITVSALGEDNAAGDVGIFAGDFFILDSLSFIDARTAFGDGGNLSLGGGNFIVLLNRSNISTSAGEARGAGNGGNIALDIRSAIIGSPFLDNNITAQAFAGDGGSIQISGFVNLFDIAERSTDFITSNDITASSEFGADGFVGINELDVDPVRGIIELPELITDLDQLLVQSCPGPGQDTSELGAFYVTGRGGVPSSPAELNSPDETGVAWIEVPPGELPGDSEAGRADAEAISAGVPDADPMIAGVEAQDWVRDANGDLWLVAQAGGAIAPPATPTVCPP